MVKESFDWFKKLQPHKRLDCMCALLDMCLPLELRFIGSVLEDLARKDFHHLRDAEVRANQRNDLANNPTHNIEDPQLRTKLSITLALMNSTNSSCAAIIFKILDSQVDGLLQLLRNKDVAEQVSLILTMAVHHPAFTFYQRLQLGETLQLVLNRIKEHFGDDDDTLPGLQEPQAMQRTVSPHSSHSPAPDVLGRITVKAIEVIGAEPVTPGKKSGLKNQREDSLVRRPSPEYEIHTTWSNGEVTQIFMKYKQFQDLHHRVLNNFPEEKEKKQRIIPHFPGNHSLRAEPLEAQIASLNSYLSQLTKAPPHILECDILHTALRKGPVIRRLPPLQQAPSQPAIKTSSPLSPQSGLQTVFTQASPLHEAYLPYGISSNRGSVCDNPAILTNSMCSSDPSQLSSSTNSPANSRTSSPAPAPLIGGKVLSATGKGVGGTESIQPDQQHQGSNIEISLNQLLCLLGLESYSDNLKEFSFKQILSMSIEDYNKAGLPVEAQVKLRTQLDQLKLTSSQNRNGIIAKLPPPSQHQPQHLPLVASVAEAPSAPYQYPFVLSPAQLPYLGPPGSSFHNLHPHILQYPSLPAAMGNHTSLLAPAHVLPSSSASTNQQQQQVPLPPLSSMTSSQQDLLASPDFPNSEASSPPNSPHLGQETHQQHSSGSTSGSSSISSGDGKNSSQTAPIMPPHVSSAPSHSMAAGGGTGTQQVPTPLPMMSPPAAVAADTIALAEVKQLKGMPLQQMHGMEEPVLDEEDTRTGFQDPSNSSKTKGVNKHLAPAATAGSMPLLASSMPGVDGGEESMIFMSGGPTPSDIILRSDGTPPPPLPPSVLSVSSQSSSVLANGYMADTPVPLQPPAMIGRAVHSLPRGLSLHGSYKVAAQPTHTTPGLQNVIKMPSLDHLPLGPGGTKNGNNNVAGAGVNGNNPALIPHATPAIPAHHHSYMPPPVAGPPHQSNNNGNNSNIITSTSSANNGNSQLISQPPLPPQADGNYHFPLMFPSPAHAASQHHQQRGIVNSVAGSTSVLNTTQSHQSSHSSSPRNCDASSVGGMYQVSANDALTGDPPTGMDRRGSPPSQTPPHQQVGSVKAQSHPSGQHSSTPSPPLVPSSGNVKASILHGGGVMASSSMLASGNESGPVGIRGNAGGAQQVLFYVLPHQNGIMPFYHPHPQPSQQAGGHHTQVHPPPPFAAFPNGLGPGAPNPSHAPQFASGAQVPPSFYGNTVYPPPHLHNHHHLQQQQHHHPNNSNNHQGRNTGSPAGVGNSLAPSQLQGKGLCYNCGQPGHRAADCKESTMETMSNSYRLSFEPKADPQ